MPDIDYPITCDHYSKKLEYLGELDEVARLWHNVQVKDKDWVGSKTFFDSKFIGKSQEIHRQINEIIEQEGLWLWDDELGGWVKNKPALTNTWKPPLSKLDYVGDRVADVFDPFQNFNVGYTVVDSSSSFTISGDGAKIDFLNFPRDPTSPFDMIYKNFGAAFFDGDLEHLHEYQMSSSVGIGLAVFWQLSNAVANIDEIIAANGDGLFLTIRFNAPGNIQIVEVDGGDLYNDIYSNPDTRHYYVKTIRAEAIGAFGTVYHYIFDNAPRSNLIDTLSVALHTSKKDFSTFAPITQRIGGATATITGLVQNYDLQLPTDGVNRPPFSQLINNGINSGIHRGGLTNA